MGATSSLFAQTTCPGTLNDGGFDATAYANVVINEVSPDAGQSDGRNDAIVELAGPAGTDISGMVVTNGEWAVILPTGSVIQPDGVFVIACSENPSESAFSTSTSGLTCPDCDFPGLPLDFDVCDDANAAYVSTSISTYGFTLDNGSCGVNIDGDQVMLFLPDGTPHDGIYWGGADVTTGGISTVGGASGQCGADSDHISVQDGASYTLGDNDVNGVVNDNAQSHIGRKSNGGDARGVNIMPIGDYDPDGNGSTNAEEVCFTMPGLNDPFWFDAGTNPTSCNSAFIRIMGSTGSHGVGASAQNPSHMDDPDLNSGWSAIPANALLPSSSGDPANQWGYTDHPTPGVENNADAWDFFIDGNEITETSLQSLALCATGPVQFELRVYNYQHVEPTTSSDPIYYTTSLRSNKMGSRVVVDGTTMAWNVTQVGHSSASTYPAAGNSADDGVTIFQYTLNPTAPETDVQLVWDDFTDCCGSVGDNVRGECYESLPVSVTIAESITVSDNSITCGSAGGDDFADGIGFIDAAALVTSANSVQTFELREGVTPGSESTTGTSVASNSTGAFTLSDALTPPLAIIITDEAGCGADQVITIDADCRAAPPCPEITAGMMDSADGTICPGTEVCFDITMSDNLPASGEIQYYFSDDANFNPYDGEGTLIGSAAFMGPDCPTEGSSVFISELSDPRNGWQCDRFIEIYNAGPCPQDLTDWILLAIGNNDVVIAFNLYGTIQPNEALIASASRAPGQPCAGDATFTPDFTFDGNWSGGGPGNFNGQSRDGATLINASSVIDVAVLSTADNNDWFENLRAERIGSVCAGTGSIGSTLCGSASSCTLLNNNWDTQLNSAPTPGTHSVSAACPSAATTVDQFCYIFDDSYCNLTTTGDFYVKAAISPYIEFTGCLNDDPNRVQTFNMNMSCPEATLTPEAIVQCVNDGPVEISLNLSSGTGPYTVVYAINGVNQPPVTGLAAGDQTIQIADGTSAISPEQTITLVSVTDQGGEMCEGTVNDAETTVLVVAPPTAQITAATDFTDCDSSNDPVGQGSFEITFTGEGPYDIEYRINNGPIQQASTNDNPATIYVDDAGEVNLITVANIPNCFGAIVPSPMEIGLPSTTTSATDPSPNCDGSMIDLTTEVTITNSPGGGTVTYYSEDPTGLGDIALGLIEIVDPTAYTIDAAGASTDEVFYTYTDPDGCVAINSFTIPIGVGDCSGFPWDGSN